MGYRETRLEQYTLLEQLAEGDDGTCVAKCGGLQKLDRMCFEMAAKGEAGCGLMKDKVLEQRLVVCLAMPPLAVAAQRRELMYFPW